MSITASAKEAANLLAQTRQYFNRGGAVFRLDDGHLRTVKPATMASTFERVARLRRQTATKGFPLSGKPWRNAA